MAGNRFRVCVLSDLEWDAAWSFFDDEQIVDVCDSLGYEIRTSPVDSETNICYLRENRFNICCVFGSRTIFKKDFLDLFEGRLFNFHPADLPKNRGAGGYSWQVLMNLKAVFISIHQMTEEVDAGDILLQESQALTEKDIYPETVIKNVYELMRSRVASQLASLFVHEMHLSLESQPRESAEYFPKLYTPVNGVVDLSWPIEFIDRFIRAFSYPYPGASVRYQKKVYRIKECRIVSQLQDVHPFIYGLVTNVTENGVYVFVHSGVIRFEKVTDENGDEVEAAHFRTGTRFYNTAKDILKARLYRPSA